MSNLKFLKPFLQDNLFGSENKLAHQAATAKVAEIKRLVSNRFIFKILFWELNE